MYKVFFKPNHDDEWIQAFDTFADTPELQLGSPTLEVEESKSGNFEALIHPLNVIFGKIEPLATYVYIAKYDSIIWYGRVLRMEKDFFGNDTIYCEGNLAFFNDTIQMNRKIKVDYTQVDIQPLVKTLLTYHNSQVESWSPEKKFMLSGSELIDVKPTNDIDKIVRDRSKELFETSMDDTTYSTFENLVSTFGGHLLAYPQERLVNGEPVNLLKYRQNYTKTSRVVRFGVDLIEFKKEIDRSEVVTVIYPQGGEDQNGNTVTVQKLTSRKVPYITLLDIDNNEWKKEHPSKSANWYMKEFGWISKMVKFSNVSDASNLLKISRAYLNKQNLDSISIEITVAELINHGLSSESANNIELFDLIHVISEPHNVDEDFPVTKMTIPLSNPSQTQITMSSKYKSQKSISTDIADHLEADQKNKTAIDNINTKLDEVDTKLDDVDTKLDDVDTKLDDIDSIISETDTRYYDFSIDVELFDVMGSINTITDVKWDIPIGLINTGKMRVDWFRCERGDGMHYDVDYLGIPGTY